MLTHVLTYIHSLTLFTGSCTKLKVFKELGRLKRTFATMKDTTFQSSGACVD